MISLATHTRYCRESSEELDQLKELDELNLDDGLELLLELELLDEEVEVLLDPPRVPSPA